MDKEKNKEKCKMYYKKHKEEIKKRMREYHWKHKEERNEYNREYGRNKWRTDPEFKKKHKERQKRNYWKKHTYYLIKSRKQGKTIAHKARLMINSRIRHGTIIQPKQCSSCKIKCTPVAHHYMGYNYPLDVIWLCTNCHGVSHQKH